MVEKVTKMTIEELISELFDFIETAGNSSAVSMSEVVRAGDCLKEIESQVENDYINKEEAEDYYNDYPNMGTRNIDL